MVRHFPRLNPNRGCSYHVSGIFKRQPELLYQNPFINFLREFRLKRLDYEPPELYDEASIVWNRMTAKKKKSYLYKDIIRDIIRRRALKMRKYNSIKRRKREQKNFSPRMVTKRDKRLLFPPRKYNKRPRRINPKIKMLNLFEMSLRQKLRSAFSKDFRQSRREYKKWLMEQKGKRRRRFSSAINKSLQ